VPDLASDAVEEWLTLHQAFVELKKRGPPQAAITHSLGDTPSSGFRATRLDPDVGTIDDQLGEPTASVYRRIPMRRAIRPSALSGCEL
jgi:hypothetical protein